MKCKIYKYIEYNPKLHLIEISIINNNKLNYNLHLLSY